MMEGALFYLALSAVLLAVAVSIVVRQTARKRMVPSGLIVILVGTVNKIAMPTGGQSSER